MSFSTFKQLKNIKIKETGGEYNYTGMANKDDQPHGWGRAFEIDNDRFIDAQWKDGVPHGYYRDIHYDGWSGQSEY